MADEIKTKTVGELTEADLLNDDDYLLVGTADSGGGVLRKVLGKNAKADKLDINGDSAENTVTFTSADETNPSAYTDTSVITSGETHKSLFNKLSTMAKNVRWLFSKMGTTDISKIGDGTVMGALTSLNDGLTNKPDSDSTFLSIGGTPIPENSDLNDYKELGTFYCSSNANARTLENSPTTSAFRMFSISGTGSTTNYFIYLLFDVGAHFYIREYDTYNSGTGFRNWVTIC